MKNRCLSKLTVLLLILSITLSFSAVYAEGAPVMSDTSHKYLKIGLAYADSAVKTAKIESSNGFLIVNGSYDGWNMVQNLTAYKELNVEYDAEVNAPVVTSADGSLEPIELPAGRALIAASTDLDGQYVKYGGKTYRDGICFTVNSNSTLNVINYIEVEHYLWGVMKNEIGDQYPTEALKAFAVTTRSFAYANRGAHSKYGFDLCTGNDCQMYRGVSSESAACTSAYQETLGMVMKYDGKIVTGNHFANSGGHTLNSEDAWVSPVPYLRAVEDPYSPELTWNVSFTFAQVKDRLRSQGINVGDVTNVEISSVTDYGAVLELTITGTEGTATLSKGKIKSAFSLKSQLFTISLDGAEEAVPEEPETEETCIYLIGADGVPVKAEINDLVVFDGETTVNGNEIDWSGFGEKAAVQPAVTVTSADGLTFHGRGSGHGVGMSQSGIKVMAQKGFSFEEILKFYFTGITIE